VTAALHLSHSLGHRPSVRPLSCSRCPLRGKCRQSHRIADAHSHAEAGQTEAAALEACFPADDEAAPGHKGAGQGGAAPGAGKPTKEAKKAKQAKKTKEAKEACSLLLMPRASATHFFLC
jgi:hypothetical protein